MKKRDKDAVKTIATMATAIIILFCGSFAKEIGQEGKAIFLIMCSLYIAMCAHAGIIGTLINTKLENKEKQ